MKVGEKAALLARAKGKTQTNIAKEIGISRISVNRFFNGRTDLKASDFCKLMNVLGIDIMSQVKPWVPNE